MGEGCVDSRAEWCRLQRGRALSRPHANAWILYRYNAAVTLFPETKELGYFAILIEKGKERKFEFEFVSSFVCVWKLNRKST